MSIIIPANSAVGGGFDVDNSLRFNSASSDYLSRTPGSAGNQSKFTLSTWIKRSRVGGGSGPEEFLFFGSPGTDTDTRLYFTGDGNADDDRLYFTSATSNSTHTRLQTNRKFRDLSAWYNIVISVNTQDGSGSSSTIQMFINGVKETSFASSAYGGQNSLFYWTDNAANAIGRRNDSGNLYYSGYMAETVLVDGQALDATSFGEFDSDSGIWKAIDVSGLSLGTTGYYLDFEDSSALGNDASGSNNFTVNNLTAIDQSTDTCTNNFATANPLNVNAGAVGTFTDGNLTIKVANSTGSVFGSSSTIGASSGKWYCEAKIITVDSTMIGVSPSPSEDARNNTSPSGANSSGAVGCLVETGNKYISDNGSTYGAATSANGIMMIALDLDNLKVYFGSGGQWANGSGAWNQSGLTSGAAISITAVASTAEGAYFFSFGDGGGSAKGKVSWNFGNPPFAISSSNADGNGYGNFEYAVPSGYYSLNTKNLAEFG